MVLVKLHVRLQEVKTHYAIMVVVTCVVHDNACCFSLVGFPVLGCVPRYHSCTVVVIGFPKLCGNKVQCSNVNQKTFSITGVKFLCPLLYFRRNGDQT